MTTPSKRGLSSGRLTPRRRLAQARQESLALAAALREKLERVAAGRGGPAVLSRVEATLVMAVFRDWAGK
jgi:hypothetical protein